MKPLSIVAKDLKNTFPELILDQCGNLEVRAESVRSVENPDPDSLIFLTDEKCLETTLHKPFAILILPVSLRNKVSASILQSNQAILFSPNVSLLIALALQKFVEVSPFENALQKNTPSRHPSSIISSSAKIDPSAIIGPHVTIQENVTIAANVWIGPGVTIEADASIGSRSEIHSHVYIGTRTQVGADCVIHPNTTIGSPGYGYAQDKKGHHHSIPQLGRVVIEDRVTIGANCAIDRATFTETRIGEGTKFDNQIHIAHNCTVGKHCLITAQFCTAGSSSLGDHVVTGGRVSMTGHVKVTSGVQLAGLSAVSNNIETPGAYGGYPLQPLKDFLRTTANLVHLTQMRKDLNRILKHLGIEEKKP